MVQKKYAYINIELLIYNFKKTSVKQTNNVIFAFAINKGFMFFGTTFSKKSIYIYNIFIKKLMQKTFTKIKKYYTLWLS